MRTLFAAFGLILATSATAESIKEPFMFHATGEFEVSLKPVSAADEAPMRMSIDKQFRGDLEATSVGQMMAGGNEANGARVYVALETVTGTLKGRQGSFILAHRGTMSTGGQALSVIIVPDSGTDQLKGIAGSLDIDIREGKHFYSIDYTLPE
ncbi:MAG: DUF3224 domain-containing protein [Sphingorhabdus sp.]|uniref:DUF3224 domain-containing protein n=1 Tax=Sphingorhabdus sp. TaxID=1902408 RepID=UPI003C8A6779